MRKIDPKMIDWLDKKLWANGMAEVALKERRPRLLLRLAAESCVGIREVGGNNKGPMVELIQKTVDGQASREAWCMAFVQTMIAYVEEKLDIASGIYASEHCMTTWRKTPEIFRVKYRPLPGAIAIWKHGNTDSGHTGFMCEWLSKSMHMVEGNTESGINPAGKVERDGGGVYSTNRDQKQNGDMKVVGFLKPFPETV